MMSLTVKQMNLITQFLSIQYAFLPKVIGRPLTFKYTIRKTVRVLLR